MVREADRHRAERVSLVVVVGIDNRYREPRPLFHHELSYADELVGRERQLRRRLRADRAVAMKPGIVHAHVDQPPEPLLGEHRVDIGAAEARCHARDQSSLEAEFEAAERPVENLTVPATNIARRRVTLDAHQRRGVAESLEAAGHLGRDQLAVGEDLEVAVGVGGQQVEQPRVEEWLAPKQSEEHVAVRLRVTDECIERLERHHRPRRLDVNPAALALEVAGVDDRKMEERREDDSATLSRLEFLDGDQPLHAEIPAEFPEAVGCHRRQHVAGHLGEDHGVTREGDGSDFRGCGGEK